MITSCSGSLLSLWLAAEVRRSYWTQLVGPLSFSPGPINFLRKLCLAIIFKKFWFKISIDSLPPGKSKGFGFVRFNVEEDSKQAIRDFNLSPGLGTKRIRVCKAFPKL